MEITKKKKNIAITFMAASAIALAIGSFSYFTDRLTADAVIKTAGSDDIIHVTPDPDVDPEGDKDPETSLEAKWEDNNDGKFDIINPGDDIDLSYDLKNLSEPVDVRETFILTSDVALNQNSPEWRLFDKVTKDKYGASEGVNVIEVEQISDYQIKYSIAPFVLDADETVNLKYNVVLDKYTSNAFQGSTCEVDYVVELRQHSDDVAVNEGWIANSDTGLTFNGSAVLAVPAAK